MKITPHEYAAVLYELVSDAKKNEVPAQVQLFREWLLRRRALGLLPRILRAFDTLWNSRQGIEQIEVVSAKKISNAVRESLKKLFAEKEVVIDERIDPAVIGGLQVRIRDTIIDGTVRARLTRLHDQLIRHT